MHINKAKLFVLVADLSGFKKAFYPHRARFSLAEEEKDEFVQINENVRPISAGGTRTFPINPSALVWHGLRYLNFISSYSLQVNYHEIGYHRKSYILKKSYYFSKLSAFGTCTLWEITKKNLMKYNLDQILCIIVTQSLPLILLSASKQIFQNHYGNRREYFWVSQNALKKQPHDIQSLKLFWFHVSCINFHAD